MSARKKRILLIGGGNYAYEAHWPAIQRQPDAELAAIVDLRSQKKRVEALWPHVPFWGVPDCCNGRESGGEGHTEKDAISFLERVPELYSPSIDAAIVSTYGCHYQYLKWALGRGWHVLADKPLTIRHGMVTDPSKAADLVRHFDELIRLADRKSRLFELATQRRYSELYERIAREMRQAAASLSDSSINSVRSIQAFTSDGYFKRLRDHTFGDLGGKVKNTGYHVIDIVTWLLRQVAHGIDTAVIQLSPLCIDRLAELAGEESSGLSQSELYASIQVTFMKRNLSYCVFQFHAQHENFALQRRPAATDVYRGSMQGDETQRAFENRTKEEELRIALGPFFRVYFRRVARVLDTQGCEPGQRSNAYLEFSRSYPGVQASQLFEGSTFKYEDPESMPAEEFLRALQEQDPASAAVKSPLKDHGAAVALFSGVYQGIARARDGDFGPVHIDLSGKWFLPPVTPDIGQLARADGVPATAERSR